MRKIVFCVVALFCFIVVMGSPTLTNAGPASDQMLMSPAGDQLLMNADSPEMLMQKDGEQLFMKKAEEKKAEEKKAEEKEIEETQNVEEASATPITIWDLAIIFEIQRMNVALIGMFQKTDVTLQVMRPNALALMIVDTILLHRPAQLAIVVVNSPPRQVAFIHKPHFAGLILEI